MNGNRLNNLGSNPYVKLHTAVLLAGGTGIFGRMITLTEIPLVWYCMLIAALCFLAILCYERRLHRYPRRVVGRMLSLGVLLAIHWVLFYASIKASNVSVGVVCIALDSFFTAIFEPLIGRHRFSLRELAISLIVLAGIMLLFGFDPRYRLGIALGVGSSAVYALYSILSKRMQKAEGVGSGNMLFYQLAGGWLALSAVMPIYAMTSPDFTMQPSALDLWLLPIFGTLFTIGPFLLQLQALRSISAFTVNLTYNLEPVYSIAFAMIIFNEGREMNLYFWLGLLIIMSAVLLQTVLALRRRAS